MAEGTSLSLELHAQPFVENIDKSAAKIEEFAKRGEKAMSELGKSADNMSTTQKRAYDVLNNTMSRHQKEIAKISKEYEILREKQKNGVLSKDEAARLKALSKEYKAHAGAVATTAKELENLAKRFKSVKSAENQVKSITPQVTHTFTNLALAIQGCKIAFDAAIEAIKSFGLAQEQQISQLAAMKAGVGDATEAYRIFNDAYRNTNYSQAGINTMTKSLLAIGLSAKEAAAMIGTVSDAAAGLGLDESGANQLLDLLKKLSTTDKFSSKDLKAFQQLGIDMGKIFGDALKMSTEDALKAIADNRIGGKDAFGTIVNYLNGEYKGAMATAKDNTIDAIGDIKGNVETAAGEIGAALIRALGIKDLLKGAVDGTEKLVELSRDYNQTGNFPDAMKRTFGNEKGTDYLDWINAIAASGTTVGIGALALKFKELNDSMTATDDAVSLLNILREYQDSLKDVTHTKFDESKTKLLNSISVLKPVDTKNLSGEAKAVVEAANAYIEKTKALNESKAAVETLRKEERAFAEEMDAMYEMYGNKSNYYFDAQKKQMDAASKYAQASVQVTKIEQERLSAQENLLDVMSKVTDLNKKSEKVVVKAALDNKGLTKELIQQVGVWNAASAANKGHIASLLSTQWATSKAALGFTSLGATIKAMGNIALTACKAVAISAIQFLVSPIGLAVLAFAGLTAAIYGAYKAIDWFRGSLKNAKKDSLDLAKSLNSINLDSVNIDNASVNTQNIENLRKSVAGTISESSELGTKLKNLADKAKELETQFNAGAITSRQYAEAMSKVYAETRKVRDEIAKISSKSLVDKDYLELAAALNKQTISADNLSEALVTLSRATKLCDFGQFDGQIKEAQGEVDKLREKVSELTEALDTEKDPKVLDKIVADLKVAEEELENAEKKVRDLEAAKTALKDTIDALRKKQEELNDQFKDGRITEEQYKSAMTELVSQAELAKGSINSVSSSVAALTTAMQNGIINAKQYASAIASIAYNSAQIAIAQKGLRDAIEAGDVNAQQGYTKRIEALAEATRSIAFNNDEFSLDPKAKEKAGKIELQDPKKNGGNGGSGGGSKGGESEAAKKYKQDKQYADQMRQLERENARYKLDLESKTALARSRNEEEYATSLQNLLRTVGAKDAAYQQQRLVNQKKTNTELLNLNLNYSKQIDDAVRNREQKLQDLVDLQKSLDLGIIKEDQFAKQKALLDKQIEYIDKSISDLIRSHKEDEIVIKVKASMNEISGDLAEKLNKKQEIRDYEKNGDGHISTADKIRMNADQEYEANVTASTQAFSQNAQNLSTSAASGDTEGVMNIGRMLGMSDDEITAKGETISSMFQTVSDAMTTAQATEIDGFARTRDSAMQHANALQSAQKAAKDYAISVGKNLGDAFSDWILGAKTAKQAMEDFAANLIRQAAQILAEWLGVYAILLLCGSNPHDASRGASKAVLGIDTKKDGGLVTGPGGPRSDSIPTMLSDGEYVINAAAVQAIGKGNLDFLNRTGHMADGGLVGGEDNLISSGTTMIINAMDALSFQDFLEFRGIQGIKQAMRNESRRFAANTGTF